MSIAEHQQAATPCWCGQPQVCPVLLDAEILQVNEVLQRNGFMHLRGARGVEAMIDLLTSRGVGERQAGEQAVG